MPITDRSEQAEFDETFENIEEADSEETEAFAQLQEWESDLAHKLNDMFQTVEADRREYEKRWLKDLRQYKGEYDPEVLANIHPKRSKAFMRLTRTKVKTVNSRMMDLLFPANGEKNWSINPSAQVHLDPMLRQ